MAEAIKVVRIDKQAYEIDGNSGYTYKVVTVLNAVGLEFPFKVVSNDKDSILDMWKNQLETKSENELEVLRIEKIPYEIDGNSGYTYKIVLKLKAVGLEFPFKLVSKDKDSILDMWKNQIETNLKK